MKAPNAASLGCGLALLGCSNADYTCSANDIEVTPREAVAVESAELTGRVLLSAQAPVERAVFEVHMTRLPRVWAPDNSTIGMPSLLVSAEVSYASDQPAGAELPSVRILLDNGVVTASGASSARGSALEAGVGYGTATVALFEMCEFDSTRTDCCPFGSQSCEGHLELSLERNPDPFPTVAVTYRVQATAKVYDCTRATPNASLTLEEGS